MTNPTSPPPAAMKRARQVVLQWMQTPVADSDEDEGETLATLIADALTEERTKALSEREAEIALLREALTTLMSAKALKNVRSMVAGWNGEGHANGPYDRHPSKLGAIIETNCGAVYALDEAMTRASAALNPARGEEGTEDA